MLGALFVLFQPTHFLALVSGVLLGLTIGAIPGLGGVVGLALLLPFTLGMEPSVAIALMMGLLSVIHTGDTFPAVLFGIPGTSGAQATIMDGYPMAKKGEADRALAAAFMASIVGGLFGSLILGLSVPVLRPIVLAFGSPEFFMVGIMGITMVAVLSSGSIVRGLLSGILGVMLAMVGPAPQAFSQRWTFDTIYLMDGIPMVPLVLGLFAVPEMIELYIKGTSVATAAEVAYKTVAATVRQAARDVFGHWFLVLRSGLIGTWIGIIPGLGSSVVDWIAYGHAAATERGARDTFGKGDIRGIIAPESANNSKSGGELIPTLAFGIPGSASMAIFLGALLYHNVAPGPAMLTTHLQLTLIMIWSIPLANIVGGGICLLLTNRMSRVSVLPAHYLVPAILVVAFFAAYQTTRDIGDLIMLVAFSLLGWIMKSSGWPRPPLILAFVLGPIIEQYLFISTMRFGYTWITRPIVITIMMVTIGSLVYGLRVSRAGAPKSPQELTKEGISA